MLWFNTGTPKFVSWLIGRSKEKLCLRHVAQVSDTAQVSRQVSLLGLIELEAGWQLVNTFLLHIIILCCIELCAYIFAA